MDHAQKPTLAEIARNYSAFIRRTLAKRRVRSVDVSDLEQEVYLRAERSLSSFDPSWGASPEASLRNWLFGICKHCATEHERQIGKWHESSLDDHLDDLESADPTGEQAYERSEHASYAVSFLARLPSERRAVILAYVVEGVPMSEVAAQLHIPVNTAWSRLRLALVELRDSASRVSVVRAVPVPPRSRWRVRPGPLDQNGSNKPTS